MSVRQHRACLAAALVVLVASVALDVHPLLGWQNYDAVQYLHLAGFALLAFAAGNGLAARGMVDGWEEYAIQVEEKCEAQSTTYEQAAVIEELVSLLEAARLDVLDAREAAHYDNDPQAGLDYLTGPLADGSLSERYRELAREGMLDVTISREHLQRWNATKAARAAAEVTA